MFLRPALLVLTSLLAVRGDDESLAVLPSDGDYGQPVYSQNILQSYQFASSWGKPANVSYSPPNSVTFNRVVLEMSVSTSGVNYDRLGFIKMDDIEIWRTSTPEPDGRGLQWSVEKDVSHYLKTFQEQHDFLVYINNNVEGGLNGEFYVNLTINFFNSGEPMNTDDGWLVGDLNEPATAIQPLVNPKGGSAWSAPDTDISVSVPALDSTVSRAVLHVLASANGDDEFWWDTIGGDVGPSRFVDVYVNGQMAGFASPFPTIFTGGMSPYLWHPIVSLRAFDVPGYFIDVTPYLPELWKGATISINVTNGLGSNEQIPDNWFINANLLTWTSSSQNSGSTNKPQFSVQTSANTYQPMNSVSVERNLVTSASLQINGQTTNVKWSQSVQFVNKPQNSGGYIYQDSKGTDSISGVPGLGSLTRDFDYPLQASLYNTSYYNVQESYNVTVNGTNFESWVDTSVWLNNGDFSSSKSSEYLGGPVHAHYAEAANQNLIVQW